MHSKPKNYHFRRFVLFVVSLIVISLIYFSIRYPYIYHAIKSTYLSGTTGPDIYDLNISPYATIESGEAAPMPTKLWSVDTNAFTHFNNSSRDLETVALLVALQDTLIYESYANGHDMDKVSNSFSMAKTVVSFLIGIAVEEGKIKSLDEPISNYLKDLKGDYGNKVTIRHLLQMASGSSWKESSKGIFSSNAAAYYGKNLNRFTLETSFNRVPGEVYQYQSGNTQFLAIILEQVYGKSISELTQLKIWSPMEMSSTAYWSKDRADGNEKAYCCLYATARDFLKLGTLFLHEGKYESLSIVPQWYMQEMITSKASNIASSQNPNQLYGLHVWTLARKEDPLIFFRGILGQYIIISPKNQWIAVRLGHKRADSFDAKELKGIQLILEGHSKDFVEYVNFVDELIQKGSK